MQLADVVNDSFVEAIQNANKIVFHAVGDTGAAKGNNPTTEATVTDLMAADVQSGGVDSRASFFISAMLSTTLVKVSTITNQFYEAVPRLRSAHLRHSGNHDGMVFGPDPDTPNATSLKAFKRNFCAVAAGPSPDSGSLVRSVMTQPGVYFSLDAPFVSIIGLYSNVLEGPGVISSQWGSYPVGTSKPGSWRMNLTSETARMNGERAIVLAVHHPPLSIDTSTAGPRVSQTILMPAARRQDCGLMWCSLVMPPLPAILRSVDGHENPVYRLWQRRFRCHQTKDGIVAPYVQGDINASFGPLVNFGYLLLTVDMTNQTRST